MSSWTLTPWGQPFVHWLQAEHNKNELLWDAFLMPSLASSIILLGL